MLLFLLLLTTGNAAALADEGTPVISRIQKSGQLVLGTSGNMPPMTFKQQDGTLDGLDISLAELMADVMKVKLITKVMPFNELIPALKNGKVDMVISNMTISPTRNLQVAFVGPYMTSGKCIVTKQENIARAEDAKALNVKDVHLVVMKDSTSEEFVHTLMPNTRVSTVNDSQEGAEMVMAGKAGGMLTDYPVCLATIKNNPDAGFVSVFSLLTYEPIGIAVPGNDALFINWTENFLERLKQTAVLEVLGKKWLGDLAPDQADQN
jgi:polar amino acid transport system substrate-binding protein